MDFHRPQARSTNLIVETVSDELVVYDKLNRRVHSMSRTMATVWRACDGQRSIQDLAAHLAQATGVPHDQPLVECILSDLARAELLESAPATWLDAVVSRRQVLSRLALAAALIPVITTLTASPAYANMSAEEQGTGI